MKASWIMITYNIIYIPSPLKVKLLQHKKISFMKQAETASKIRSAVK